MQKLTKDTLLAYVILAIVIVLFIIAIYSKPRQIESLTYFDPTVGYFRNIPPDNTGLHGANQLVVDEVPPDISDVSVDSNYQATGVLVTWSVVIDDADLVDADLYIGDPVTDEWIVYPMFHNYSNRFRASIKFSHSDAARGAYYYIVASDRSGNVGVLPARRLPVTIPPHRYGGI